MADFNAIEAYERVAAQVDQDTAGDIEDYADAHGLFWIHDGTNYILIGRDGVTYATVTETRTVMTDELVKAIEQ